MLMLRLSDAIDLLDGKSGVQTHRSHWAAKTHAKSLGKVARRHELLLTDGRSLPVSSSYKDAVKTMLKE
jgi:DNA-binding LytR/AlgR family response regulator